MEPVAPAHYFPCGILSPPCSPFSAPTILEKPSLLQFPAALPPARSSTALHTFPCPTALSAQGHSGPSQVRPRSTQSLRDPGAPSSRPSLCCTSRSRSPWLHLTLKLRGLSADPQTSHTDPPCPFLHASPLSRRCFPHFRWKQCSEIVGNTAAELHAVSGPHSMAYRP